MTAPSLSVLLLTSVGLEGGKSKWLVESLKCCVGDVGVTSSSQVSIFFSNVRIISATH